MSNISNLTKNDKFGDWFNKINDIIEYLNIFSVDKDNIPPKNHASNETIYGVGNKANYGHVRLSDAINDEYKVEHGYASTPYATKRAYDKALEAIGVANNSLTTSTTNSQKIEDLEAELQEISGEIINHASEKETYGVGTSSLYGHLKLSDATDSSFSDSSGVAATPYAVNKTYILANNAFTLATNNNAELQSKAPTNHASAEIIYGLGNDDEYGHVKIVDSLSEDDATKGISVSPKAVKTLETSLLTKINDSKDSINTLSNSISSIQSAVNEKAPKNHAVANTEYGIGTDSSYGHVKLSDAINSTSSASSGIAASSKAVSDVNANVVSLTNSVSEIQTTLNGGGSTTKYLRGDGTWAIPQDTKYSSGTGVSVSGTKINLAEYGIADSYGPADNQTPDFGEDFSVPYITTDAYGRVTALTKTITIPDSVMTGSTKNNDGFAGLVPAPTMYDSEKFLRGDGTWASTDEVLYAVMEGAGTKKDENDEVIKDETTGEPILFDGKSGLVPAPIAEDNEHEKFLRGDGTWSSPKIMTGSTADSDGDKGFVPAPLKETSDHTKFLKGDGTWAVPYTLPSATSSKLGGVKIGSNISVSSGTISLSKDNVTNALGYTPVASVNNTSVDANGNVSITSVETATKWNGSSKTVSTAAASGGVNGDIWFQYI